MAHPVSRHMRRDFVTTHSEQEMQAAGVGSDRDEQTRTIGGGLVNALQGVSSRVANMFRQNPENRNTFATPSDQEVPVDRRSRSSRVGAVPNISNIPQDPNQGSSIPQPPHEANANASQQNNPSRSPNRRAIRQRLPDGWQHIDNLNLINELH